jgi:threonine dehydrogenase-like Zn-dependent dehydrogenase
MMQAIRSARPGGFVSYVGVPHRVELDGVGLFLHMYIYTVAPHLFGDICLS